MQNDRKPAYESLKPGRALTGRTSKPRLTSGVDPLTTEQRQLNMSRVRAKDTKPEMLIRRALHAKGFRYRLHVSKLPGRPDMVFASSRAIIFVHGCFWHGHHCPLFRLPATRMEFWAEKISKNRSRDDAAQSALRNSGWRVLTIWECAVRGPARRSVPDVVADAQAFILSDIEQAAIEGSWTAT